VLLLGLFSCGEDNSSSSNTISLNSNDSPLKKDDIKVNSNKTNDTLVAKNNTVKDFISNLDLATVLNSEVSMDFACLGIFGNELGEHHDLCIKKKYSLYTYDTLWSSSDLNKKITNKPRTAFLTENDFEKKRYIPESFSLLYYNVDFLHYINSDYHYHVGNGFAFNNLNNFNDFNNDGYLDLKIKYTITSGYAGAQYARAVMNGNNYAIKEEYDKKIKEKIIDSSISLNQYISELPPEDYGFFGIGYLTKKSKDGLLLFYKK
tara:strand:- start:328 stop:1113 length:786 start_codon:yes stop_codon:yes gene_type:complete